jgi:hypothetical protein
VSLTVIPLMATNAFTQPGPMHFGLADADRPSALPVAVAEITAVLPLAACTLTSLKALACTGTWHCHGPMAHGPESALPA